LFCGVEAVTVGIGVTVGGIGVAVGVTEENGVGITVAELRMTILYFSISQKGGHNKVSIVIYF
jgi:hypothetical protein